jgi:peptidoglycan biosynthesis protein MviN/MurJ (putative lipid II flippase)
LITLGIPRTGLNIVTQIRVITFTGFATVLGPGVLSSYLFAQRITDAVVQIIQQSVTSASIPVLSRDVVEHKVSLYQETVKRYVLALGGVGILVSLAIYVLKDYIIYILYGATAQNALIGFFLVGFLLILPIHMMTGYLVVSLYSMKDTKSVFFSGFVSSVLGVVTAYVTLPQGVISLVYGVVVTFYSSFLMVFFLYNKKKLS